MTNAKTLNQIIAELEAWASSHLQVHSFGQGDIWEVSPSSSAFTFPLMWVTPSTAEPRQNELVEQFNVIVCDLVDNGEANELEVLSDTRQILKDLVSWYRQQHSAAYIVEFQGAITPFTERFAERVSGNALTIRLRQPDDYDECAIPLGTPIPAPPFCEPATYTLNDTSTPPNQLSSGSIPSGGSAVIVAPDATVLRDGLPFGSVPSGGSIDVPSAVTPCADATVELNSVQMATIPSGGTENIQVRQSSGSTLVGSQQGQYWRIGDSPISLNGTLVDNVKAEDSLNIPVIQDGSPAGSWNGTQWVIPSCPAGGVSLAVTVSDNNPNVGQTITITATPSAGYTPTNYLFFARHNGTIIEIADGASNVVNWTVTISGTIEIIAQAVESSDKAWNNDSVTAVTVIVTNGIQLWGDPFRSNVVPPTYPDISGFSRDGTMVNAPTFVAGTLAPNGGGYVELNGVDQNIINFGTVADFAYIQNTAVFSLSFWIKTDNTSLRQIIAANGTGTGTKGVFVVFENGAGAGTRRLRCTIFRGVSGQFYTVETLDNVITDTDWHHVCVTLGGIAASGQWYVDGAPVTTNYAGTFVLSTGISTNTLTIGSGPSIFLPFDGRIGPFYAHDIQLSGAQVLQNFDADKARYGL